MEMFGIVFVVCGGVLCVCREVWGRTRCACACVCAKRPEKTAKRHGQHTHRQAAAARHTNTQDTHAPVDVAGRVDGLDGEDRLRRVEARLGLAQHVLAHQQRHHVAARQVLHQQVQVAFCLCVLLYSKYSIV